MRSRNHFIVWSLIIYFSCIVAAYAGNLTESCPAWAYLDSLGGASKSDPIIHSWNDLAIVAVQGTDNGVYVNEWNNLSLTGWYLVNGGYTLARPEFVVDDSALWLYVKGGDGFIYKSRYLGLHAWSSWENTTIDNLYFENGGADISNGYKVYRIWTGQDTVTAAIKLGKCVTPYTSEWAKDLIIYEATTKEYTSPEGPHSGTFNSFREKIPYLSQLGITGLWLNGFSLSHPTFYYLWNGYACIRPDVIDPSLGTSQEFKDLIQEAHDHGMKIFIDVVDHAVVPNSSLIAEHPAWFRDDENPWRWRGNDHTCQWGMKDYDWVGDQKGLEKFWIDTWENYAIEYGVDGYRIDLGSMRDDLWARIKDDCKDQGHEIVVFGEGSSGVRDFGRLHGVYDFWQWGTDAIGDFDRFGQPYNNPWRPDLTNIECVKYGCYGVEIRYSDNTSQSLQIPIVITDAPQYSGKIAGYYLGATADRVGSSSKDPDSVFDNEVVVTGINSSKQISNIIVKDLWIDGQVSSWSESQGNGYWYNIYELSGDALHIFFPTHQYESEHRGYLETIRFQTLQLSCHDFSGYGIYNDRDYNNSAASRYKFGYGMMFTPLIPLFMAGEEFKNPYATMTDPYPAGIRALLASQMQWDYLNRIENAAFLEDAKKIISIRKNNSALKYFSPLLKGANVVAVNDYASNFDVSYPYVRWLDDEAFLVIGNHNKQSPLSISIDLETTLAEINLAGKGPYQVTDLWTKENYTLVESNLSNFRATVDPDNFKIYRISINSSACQNQCLIDGVNQCSGRNYQVCRDNNGDGCLEWSTPISCSSGQTCVNGNCVSGRVCDPGSVNGCRACRSDGSGWQDDNSKCAENRVCQYGACLAPCQNWVEVQNLGGRVLYDPSIISSNDRLIIGAIGTDDSVWINEYVPDAKPSPWYSLAGTAVSGTQLKGEAEGISISTIGTDLRVWQRSYLSSGNWSYWQVSDETQLEGIGPSIALFNRTIYRSLKNSDGSVEISKCIDLQTLSGKVINGSGQGIPNVTIELCGAAGNPVTQETGNWSALAALGTNYCARIVSGLPPGYGTITAPGNNVCHITDNSYEYQVAGQNKFLNCSAANVGTWDLAGDNNLDYIVEYQVNTTTTSTTSTTLPNQCVLKGNYPPCEEITLQEIIDAINAWAVDVFALTDVINLINAWAYG
jgi:hypothetical protein